MPVEPEGPGDGLVIAGRDIGPAVVLTVRGELLLRTVPQLRRALEKSLADRGRVLVDLAGLMVTWRPAVEVFPTALVAMTGWPAARLVLFGAQAQTDRALRSMRHLRDVVHLARSEAEAVALLDARPRRLSRRTALACDVMAPKWGRLMVEDVFADWEVTDVDVDAVRMVVSELVTNAVVHARTSSELTLTLTDLALHVRVRDHRPGDGPEAVDAGPDGSAGLGMVMVAGLSMAWGVSRHDDGKTVWATMARRASSRGPAGI